MIDYCIVGGGVLGCAVGKYLLGEEPDAHVVILEQFSGVGQGNTIRSNAAYRNIFDTLINIQLASSSINYYKAMETEGYDFGRKEIGYLFLLNQQQAEQYGSKNLELNGEEVSFYEFLKYHGIGYELLSPEALQEKFPQLELRPDTDTATLIQAQEIVQGLLGKVCGNFSPDLVVQHYYSRFRELGGEINLNTRVISVKLGNPEAEFDPEYIPAVWQVKEVKALEIRNAEGELEFIEAKKFILTTGAWINQLLDPLGAVSLIKPKKRQLFTIDNLTNYISNTAFNTGEAIFPFTILPTGGVFIKPLEHAACVVVGTSDVIGRSFERNYNADLNSQLELDDPKAEGDFFVYNILPVLQSYFPGVFDEVTAKGSAGHYAYSVDKYPVIDKVEELPNLFFGAGASGSGIMKADSIARILVGRVLGQETVTLFGDEEISVERFGIKHRDLPNETLVL